MQERTVALNIVMPTAVSISARPQLPIPEKDSRLTGMLPSVRAAPGRCTLLEQSA